MAERQNRLNPFSWDRGAWRKFFAVSACWNLFGAVPAIVWPRLNMLIYYGVRTDDYYMLLLNRSAWLAILIFGVGYMMVAADPEKFRGIVVLGIIGKVAVAAIWFHLFSIDKATGLAFFAAAGDSIFTVFFALYLFIGDRSAEKA